MEGPSTDGCNIRARGTTKGRGRCSEGRYGVGGGVPDWGVLRRDEGWGDGFVDWVVVGVVWCRRVIGWGSGGESKVGMGIDGEDTVGPGTRWFVDGMGWEGRVE